MKITADGFWRADVSRVDVAENVYDNNIDMMTNKLLLLISKLVVFNIILLYNILQCLIILFYFEAKHIEKCSNTYNSLF